jgi:hypothetical protein
MITSYNDITIPQLSRWVAVAFKGVNSLLNGLTPVLRVLSYQWDRKPCGGTKFPTLIVATGVSPVLNIPLESLSHFVFGRQILISATGGIR